jgi:hypothetical protein
MVSVCGGTVLNVSANTYQVVTSSSYNVDYQDIGFQGTQDVKYQLNITNIKDSSGVDTKPAQPGWVYLTSYQYNWGSIRDILNALGLELVSYTDDPNKRETEVVISWPPGWASTSTAITTASTTSSAASTAAGAASTTTAVATTTATTNAAVTTTTAATTTAVATTTAAAVTTTAAAATTTAAATTADASGTTTTASATTTDS